MTTLAEIIAGLVTATARSSCELPRGLWLVYYPSDDERPSHRLVVGRKGVLPSVVEQRIVFEALLGVLDCHPSRVVVDADSAWAEVDRLGDWCGARLDWYMLPVTDAFSPDPDCARRVRLALEERQRRIEKRRAKSVGNRKPMRGGEE